MDTAFGGRRAGPARVAGVVGLLDRDGALVDEFLSEQVQVHLRHEGVDADPLAAICEGFLEVDLDLEVVRRPQYQVLESQMTT